MGPPKITHVIVSESCAGSGRVGSSRRTAARRALGVNSAYGTHWNTRQTLLDGTLTHTTSLSLSHILRFSLLSDTLYIHTTTERVGDKQ
jgi:hypothetical protein